MEQKGAFTVVSIIILVNSFTATIWVYFSLIFWQLIHAKLEISPSKRYNILIKYILPIHVSFSHATQWLPSSYFLHDIEQCESFSMSA